MRLRQILLNLGGKAVKFTDRGGVAIRAALDSDSGAEAVLRFTVSDTGIGIPEKDAARLFDSFVQGDDSSARRYSGTGLGLAIAKQLAVLGGGSIGVESRPGQGSTFWFTARFEKAEGERKPAGGTAAFAPAAFAGTAVLLAEDNGCSVETVSNGREAVAAATRRQYDLIFMDGQMPVLDGLAATKEIRASGACGERTPIIAVTASAMVGDRERCLAAGMDDYITKPLRLEDFAEVLGRWAGAKRDPGS